MRHSVGNTIHFWDGTNIAAEKTGSTVTVYFRALNLVYSQTGNTKTFYVFNGHGDVIALTNNVGTITRTYEYDAFGVEDEPSVYDTNPFRYCGEYYDSETKALYLRARYYDASTGRFTQQDDWEYAKQDDPLSLNLYTYCKNNSVNYADEDGHFWHLVAGAVIGGLVSGAIKLASNLISKEENVLDGVGIAMLTGAASGFVAATGAGVLVEIAAGAAISMAGNAAQQIIDINNNEQSEFNYGDMFIDGAIGAVASAFGGAGASSVKSKPAAGGVKQMINLGQNTVKRVSNSLLNKGVKAAATEARKAAKYYLKSTIKCTKNLIRSLVISATGNIISEIENPISDIDEQNIQNDENPTEEIIVEETIVEENVNNKDANIPRAASHKYQEVCI